MYIDEQLKMDLNGVPQFVSIRAEKENAPLLVYLHGGPGDAALPLVMKYNKMLEQQFTLVVWEQRGAGKSYYSMTSTPLWSACCPGFTKAPCICWGIHGGAFWAFALSRPIRNWCVLILAADKSST